MATKITRNDYYKLLRETGKIPKDGEYEILPLDLSAYPLTDNTKKIVDAVFTEESFNRHGAYMLSGHWFGDISYQFSGQCDFELHQVNSYNSFSFSDEQLALFTYCEGDIHLTLFTDEKNMSKEKQNCSYSIRNVTDTESDMYISLRSFVRL